MNVVATPKRGRGRPRNDEDNTAATEALRRIASRLNLDRNAQKPLWLQLRNALSDSIGTGGLAPHDRLPSEQALCEIFAVSRPVVRAALSSLAADRQLVKLPRKGIFVAPPRQETDFLTSNVSVHSDLTARGHTVTSDAFLFERAEPDEDERRVFGIPEGGTVVRVGRIYRSDGRPITHTLISLPGHKVPDMEKIDITGRSIFQVLEEEYGLVSKRAERWFTAELPGPEVAARMGIAPDQPVIAIESIAYDPDGAPLEYYRAFYNSAVARIHVSTGGVNN
jgi:GntR family transcriptional regulator